MPLGDLANAFAEGYTLGTEIAALITGTPTQTDRIEAKVDLANWALLVAINDIATVGEDSLARDTQLAADLGALSTSIDTWLSEIHTHLHDIITALGHGVVDDQAPSWYTAPTNPPDSDIANAVWDAQLAHMGDLTGQPTEDPARYLLATAANAAVQTGLWKGGDIPGCPQFSLWFTDITDYYAWVGGLANVNTASAYPTPIDPTAVLPGDTVLSYLQREQSGFGWLDSASSALELPGRVVSLPLGEGGPLFYVCNVSNLDLAQIWREPTPTDEEAPFTAPIWPGSANATLGEQISLSNGLELVGPMDGILIAVTGTPSGASRFMFGDASSWRYLGAAMFESDSGHSEWPITLGPASGLITPRTMAHAASCRLRLNPGFTGTVRTWTRT